MTATREGSREQQNVKGALEQPTGGDVLLLDADPATWALRSFPPRLRCRRQVKQRPCMLFSTGNRLISMIAAAHS